MPEKPEMIKVTSSNANSMGYDAIKKELFVEFKGGSTYVYSNVPESVFGDLKITSSFGKALNGMVKGKYSYRKL